MGMNIYSLLDFLKNEKLEIKLEINNNNKRKKIIFWNFEDQKEWENRGITKEIFKTTQ
jgi:hypothetical protein